MANINYIISAAQLDPTVGFKSYTHANEYNNLVWVTNSVPQETLETNFFTMEKLRVKNGFIRRAREDILTGFVSDVLSTGTNRMYLTDIQSQIAIIGAVVYTDPTSANPDGYTFDMPSYDLTTGDGRIDEHTNSQLRILLSKLAEKVTAIFDKMQSKSDAILAIDVSDIPAALDTLYALTWD